ncbi:Chemotaxis response regulator protein-glutamate methylesterase CheB [Enhygromyxa salina]|uniref:protein-glutamate methylesterase n=1 Tax=Enhygromyxa salina TaxID=215803 RepID=A0A0C1Z9I4_9BACT|nr:chemotaxis protein CheB [Enhygromyxa salina]KIG14214.1 Chemotaxis response regulator protein-glutamate methylesterase CheB [Enhygromyxa salina]
MNPASPKRSAIRVVVVDDSDICCEVLTEQLEADGDIQVVGTAHNGRTALARLAATKPDVVTVDLNMPGMNGLALIEAIMVDDPRPILVVTGLDAKDRDLAVAATARGALELVNKARAQDEQASAALRASVRRLATVAVNRVTPTASQPVMGSTWPTPHAADQPYTPIVGFGSSAGGPQALFEILTALPSDLPAAIAITHHLPADFGSAFARLLRSQVHFDVEVAHEPIVPSPGLLVLAPGGMDLVLEAGSLRAHRPATTALLCPSVDVLLTSLAAAPGAHVGVVLSGLGLDGSAGLAAMLAAGKLTIVQHRASAAVWGMPRAALPSALEVLDTAAIGDAIVRWVRERARLRGHR